MNALLWERGQSNVTQHHLLSDAPVGQVTVDGRCNVARELLNIGSLRIA